MTAIDLTLGIDCVFTVAECGGNEEEMLTGGDGIGG